MIIETKFNVGQKVWRLFGSERCAYCDRTREPDRDWGVYDTLDLVCEVRAGERPGGEKYDECLLAGSASFCTSDDLFFTRREAQAACDKRNKK